MQLGMSGADETVVTSVAPVESIEVNASTGGRNTRRDRKQTSFFDSELPPPEGTVKKIAMLEQQKAGMGIPLSQNEVFCREVQKYLGDSELLKGLHMLFYNCQGKKLEIKKALRAFSGYGPEINVQDKIAKVMEKKKFWTVANLKKALVLFGLERSGERDALVRRMVEYIAAPCLPPLKSSSGVSEDVVVKKSSSSSSKKKKSDSSKSTKSSKKAAAGGKATKKVKRVTAPSAFMLFAQSIRPEVVAEMDGASFGEISKVVAAKWNTLSERERKPWNAAAAATKAAMGLSSGASAASSGKKVTADDIFGEDSNDEADNEGNGAAESDDDGDDGEEDGAGMDDDGAEEDDFKED